jgi:predicted transcriptional regulator
MILEITAALAVRVVVQVNMLVTLFMVALELPGKVLQEEMVEILAMVVTKIDSRAAAVAQVAAEQAMERSQTAVLV